MSLVGEKYKIGLDTVIVYKGVAISSIPECIQK